MTRGRSGVIVPTVLVLVFLYLPLAVVVLYSFNASAHASLWKGFTTGWYVRLWNDAQALAALKNSLILAATSTAISTTLGTMLGYGMARHQFRGKELVSQFLRIPICIPDIVLAVALVLFYSTVRSWAGWLNFGMSAMILSHVTFQIPFVALVVRSRLRGVDPSLDEAAFDLGASRWQRFWHITLPLMKPGILAGSLLAFTLSLDDFVVSFFTSGAGTTTLPILIYSSVKRGVTAEVNALSTLMIAAAVIGTIGVIFLERQRKNNDQDQLS